MPLLSPSDTAFAEHWQALDSAEVLRRCGTDPAVGLSADLAAQRLVERGANALPEPPPRPLWRTFLRQFKSPLIYILFAAAALTGESDAIPKRLGCLFAGCSRAKHWPDGPALSPPARAPRQAMAKPAA